MENPWLNLEPLSSRRIDSTIMHNFFWIMDDHGRFGIRISLNQLIRLPDDAPKLKGIEIIIRNSDSGTAELYLILNNNSEWQIFLSLCNDLFDNSINCKDDEQLMTFAIGRLLKWQKFLSQNSSRAMTEQQQMGLITELVCLKDFIIPNFSIQESILSWVGPDFDKQDFSLEAFFIEVKSYISSKGSIVRISSLGQLNNSIKPLYLLAFGISRTENGFTVPAIVDSLKGIIGIDLINLEVFENKLAQYGYIENFTEPPFYSYKTDIVTSYTVSDDFPKILSGQVKPQITAAEYSIDLARCSDFEMNLMSIIKSK